MIQIVDMLVFLLVFFAIIKGVGLFMDYIFIPMFKYALSANALLII